MPFADNIDYQAASVIFNVTNTSGWLPVPVQWGADDDHDHRATNANEAQWWLPDAHVSDVSIAVRCAYVHLPLDRQTAGGPQHDINNALIWVYRRLSSGLASYSMAERKNRKCMLAASSLHTETAPGIIE